VGFGSLPASERRSDPIKDMNKEILGGWQVAEETNQAALSRYTGFIAGLFTIL
jgi:hypothetical protein